MKKLLKAFIPIAMALVMALAASVLVYRWLQTQTSAKEVVKIEAQSEAVPVAVATVDLPWGTQLKTDMAKTIPYLKESLPPGYSSDPDSLAGRVLITPLKAHEPILESKLAPTTVTAGGVAAVLKPGKRALAVKGDKVIGLSGLIRPGHRVDVLVTLTDPRTKREVTKIVLQDILVLATGTEIDENGKKGEKTSPIDTYTLELTPEEGEKLALAATQGRLQFALRGTTDQETVLTKGATIPDALASYYAAQPQVIPKPKEGKPVVVKRPVRRASVVQVIKGTNVGKEKF